MNSKVSPVPLVELATRLTLTHARGNYTETGRSIGPLPNAFLTNNVRKTIIPEEKKTRKKHLILHFSISKLNVSK